MRKNSKNILESEKGIKDEERNSIELNRKEQVCINLAGMVLSVIVLLPGIISWTLIVSYTPQNPYIWATVFNHTIAIKVCIFRSLAFIQPTQLLNVTLNLNLSHQMLRYQSLKSSISLTLHHLHQEECVQAYVDD